MNKTGKRILSILTSAVMAAGILMTGTTAVFAEDPQAISEVKGTVEEGIPAYGLSADALSVKTEEDAPYFFETGDTRALWYKLGESGKLDEGSERLEKGDYFEEGKYVYRTQLRIAAEDAAKYSFAEDL